MPEPTKSLQFRAAAVCLIIIVLAVLIIALQKHLDGASFVAGYGAGTIMTAIIALVWRWTRLRRP